MKTEFAAQVTGLFNMNSNAVRVEDVLTHLTAKLGSNQVRAHQSYTDFELIFHLDTLQSIHADALGLHGVAAIYMHVKLPSGLYFGGQDQPAVDISLGKKILRHLCRSRLPTIKVLISDQQDLSDFPSRPLAMSDQAWHFELPSPSLQTCSGQHLSAWEYEQ